MPNNTQKAFEKLYTVNAVILTCVVNLWLIIVCVCVVYEKDDVRVLTYRMLCHKK